MRRSSGRRQHHRHGSRDRGDSGNTARGAREPARHVRELREGGERSGHHSNLAEGNVQERPHDLRIEVGSRTAHEFGACGGEGHGLLVRPGRGHDFEAVADGHQAPGIGDLIAAQPPWIPGAVEFLVVLPDAVGPRPEPGDERRLTLLAGGRVTER